MCFRVRSFIQFIAHALAMKTVKRSDPSAASASNTGNWQKRSRVESPIYSLRGVLVAPSEKQEPVWTDLAPDGYAEQEEMLISLTKYITVGPYYCSSLSAWTQPRASCRPRRWTFSHVL